MGLLSRLAAAGRRIDLVRDSLNNLNISKDVFAQLDAVELEIAKAQIATGENVRGVLTEEEVMLGTTQGKIACIKAYRTRFGMVGTENNYMKVGLAEAKQEVEAYFNKHGLTFYTYPSYYNKTDNIGIDDAI